MKDHLLAAALLPHPPILLPEIGRGEEAIIHKTKEAMEEVARRFAEKNPDTLILISPHGALFQDTITALQVDKLEGNLAQFGAGNIKCSYETDLELLHELYEQCYREEIPLLLLDQNIARDFALETTLDHGAMVPLYFFEDKWKKKPKLIHINYGLLPAEELSVFGRILSWSIKKLGRKAVVIASGDLSHRLSAEGNYGFREEGPLFDEKIQEIFREGKLKELLSIPEHLSEGAGECGLRSLQILQGILEGESLRTENLSYEGPWGVGYLVSYAEITEKKDIYLELVQETLEHYFETGERLIPGEKYKELKEKRGACFISLHKFGQLRGCIGTLFPTEENLAEEIISNTLSASLEDSRFTPLEKDEVENLVLSTDLLGEPEETNLEGLDPKRYGVIVKKGGRVGVLLPDLEGIDTVEEQVSIARRKAYIAADEEVELLRFKVERHD